MKLVRLPSRNVHDIDGEFLPKSGGEIGSPFETGADVVEDCESSKLFFRQLICKLQSRIFSKAHSKTFSDWKIQTSDGAIHFSRRAIS